MDIKGKLGKKKVLVVVLGALAVTAVLGAVIYGAMKSGKGGVKEIATEIEDGLSKEEEAKLDEYINRTIDAYVADFSKQKSFSEVMTEEDKSALGKDILTELSKDMSEEELTMMKEILVKLFSDDSTLTITGSAYFTDETKAYIAQNIKTAVHDAISGYSTEGGENYTELQKTVERIVTESVGSGNAGYTLSQTDLDNLRQSVLSSIGNVSGAAGLNGSAGVNGSAGLSGRDGKDGRDGNDGKDGKDGERGKDGEPGKNGVDGRDGRDGKDGVNGQDGRDGKDGYTPVKGTDYFTEKEVNSIIDTIIAQTEKYVDKKEADATAAITASIQKSVTEVFNEALAKATEEYKTGISGLDNKLSKEINVNVTTLEETIGALEESVNTKFNDVVSSVNDEFQAFSANTDAKIKELADSEATFELINNADGTYTLRITDPKAGRNTNEEEVTEAE